MNFKELIASDFEAYPDTNSFFKGYIYNRGFRITFWLRLCQLAKNKNKILYIFSRIIYGNISRKYGTHIPVSVKIGKGLRIFHGFGLVINGSSVLGDNVTLQHEITLAAKNNGAPIIGNNVKIAPGSKILGKVKIGNNVIVGANSVVTKDVPDNAVVAGVPAKILHYRNEHDKNEEI